MSDNNREIVRGALVDIYQYNREAIKNNTVNFSEMTDRPVGSYIELVARTHPERLGMDLKEVKKDPHEAYTRYLGRDTIETGMKLFDAGIKNGLSTKEAFQTAFDYTSGVFQDLTTEDYKAPNSKFMSSLHSLAGTYDSQGGVYLPPDKFSTPFIQNSIDHGVDLPGPTASFFYTFTEPALIGKVIGNIIGGMKYGQGYQTGKIMRNAIRESFEQYTQPYAKSVYSKGWHNVATYGGMALMVAEAVFVPGGIAGTASKIAGTTVSGANILKSYMVVNAALSDFQEETGLSQRYVYGNKNQKAQTLTFLKSRAFDAFTISLSNMLSPAVASSTVSKILSSKAVTANRMATTAFAMQNIDVLFDTALDFGVHNMLSMAGVEFTAGQERQLSLLQGNLSAKSVTDKVIRELFFRAANRSGSTYLKTLRYGKTTADSNYANRKYWQTQWGMGKVKSFIAAQTYKMYGTELREIGDMFNKNPQMYSFWSKQLPKDIQGDLQNRDLFTELIKNNVLDKTSLYYMYLAKEKATNVYFQNLFDKSTGKLNDWNSMKNLFSFEPISRPVASLLYKAGPLKEDVIAQQTVEVPVTRRNPKTGAIEKTTQRIPVGQSIFGASSFQYHTTFGIMKMKLGKNASPEDIEKYAQAIISYIEANSDPDDPNSRIEAARKAGNIMEKEFPNIHDNFIDSKGTQTSELEYNLNFRETISREFIKHYSQPGRDTDDAKKLYQIVFNRADTTDVPIDSVDIVKFLSTIEDHMGRENDNLIFSYYNFDSGEIEELAGKNRIQIEQEQYRALQNIIAKSNDWKNSNILRKILSNYGERTPAVLMMDLANRIQNKVTSMNSEIGADENMAGLVLFRAEFLRALGGYDDADGKHYKGVLEEYIEGLKAIRTKSNDIISEEQKINNAFLPIHQVEQILMASGYRLPETVYKSAVDELTEWSGIFNRMPDNTTEKRIRMVFDTEEDFNNFKKELGLDKDTSYYDAMLEYYKIHRTNAMIGIDRFSAITNTNMGVVARNAVIEALSEAGKMNEHIIIRNMFATEHYGLGKSLPDDIDIDINGQKFNSAMLDKLFTDADIFNDNIPDNGVLRNMFGAALIKRYSAYRFQGYNHYESMGKLKQELFEHDIYLKNFRVYANEFKTTFGTALENSEVKRQVLRFTKDVANTGMFLIDKINMRTGDTWETHLPISRISEITFDGKLYSPQELIKELQKRDLIDIDYYTNLAAIATNARDYATAHQAIDYFLTSRLGAAWSNDMEPEEKNFAIKSIIDHAKSTKHIGNIMETITKIKFADPDIKRIMSTENITRTTFLKGNDQFELWGISTNNLEGDEFKKFIRYLEEAGIFFIDTTGANATGKFVRVKAFDGLTNKYDQQGEALKNVLTQVFSNRMNRESRFKAEDQFNRIMLEELNKLNEVDANEKGRLHKYASEILKKMYDIQQSMFDRLISDESTLNPKYASENREQFVTSVEIVRSEVQNLFDIIDQIKDTLSIEQRRDLEMYKAAIDVTTEQYQKLASEDPEYSKIYEESKQKLADLIKQHDPVKSEETAAYLMRALDNNKLQSVVDDLAQYMKPVKQILEEAGISAVAIEETTKRLMTSVKVAENHPVIGQIRIKQSNEYNALVNNRKRVMSYIDNNDTGLVLKELFKTIALDRHILYVDKNLQEKRFGALTVEGSMLDREGALVAPMRKAIEERYRAGRKVKIFLTYQPEINGVTLADGASIAPKWALNIFKNLFYGEQRNSKIAQKTIAGTMAKMLMQPADNMLEYRNDGSGIKESTYEYTVDQIRVSGQDQPEFAVLRNDFKIDEDTFVIDIANYKTIGAQFFRELGISDNDIRDMLSLYNEDIENRPTGVVVEFTTQDQAENYMKTFTAHSEYVSGADNRRLGLQPAMSEPQHNSFFNLSFIQKMNEIESSIGNLEYDGNTTHYVNRAFAKLKSINYIRSSLYSGIYPIMTGAGINSGRMELVSNDRMETLSEESFAKLLENQNPTVKKFLERSGRKLSNKLFINNSGYVDYALIYDLAKKELRNRPTINSSRKSELKELLREASVYLNLDQKLLSKQEINDLRQQDQYAEYLGADDYQDTVNKLLDFLSEENGVVVKDESMGDPLYYVMITRNPAIEKGQLSHMLIRGIAAPNSHGGIELPHSYISKISSGDYDGDALTHIGMDNKLWNQQMDYILPGSSRSMGMTALTAYSAMKNSFDYEQTGNKKLVSTVRTADMQPYDIVDKQYRVGAVIKGMREASAMLSLFYDMNIPINAKIKDSNNKEISVSEAIEGTLKKSVSEIFGSVDFNERELFRFARNITLNPDNNKNFVVWTDGGIKSKDAKFHGAWKYNNLVERTVKVGNSEVQYTMLSIDESNRGIDGTKRFVLLADIPGEITTRQVASLTMKNDIITAPREVANQLLDKLVQSNVTMDDFESMDTNNRFVNLLKDAASEYQADNMLLSGDYYITKLDGYATSVNRMRRSLGDASTDVIKDRALDMVESYFGGKNEIQNELPKFMMKMAIASQFEIAGVHAGDVKDRVFVDEVYRPMQIIGMFKDITDSKLVMSNKDMRVLEDSAKIVTDLVNNLTDRIVNGKLNYNMPSLNEARKIMSFADKGSVTGEEFTERINVSSKYSDLITGSHQNTSKRVFDPLIFRGLYIAKNVEKALQKKNVEQLPIYKLVNKNVAEKINPDYFNKPFDMIEVDIGSGKKRMVYVNDLLYKANILAKAMYNHVSTSRAPAYKVVDTMKTRLNIPIVIDSNLGSDGGLKNVTAPEQVAEIIYRNYNADNGPLSVRLSIKEIDDILKQIGINFDVSTTTIDQDILFRALNAQIMSEGTSQEKLARFLEDSGYDPEKPPLKVYRFMKDNDNNDITVDALIHKIERTLQSSTKSPTDVEKVKAVASHLIQLLPNKFQEIAMLRASGLTNRLLELMGPKNIPKYKAIINSDNKFEISTAASFDNIIKEMARQDSKHDIIDPGYLNHNVNRIFNSAKKLVGINPIKGC